MEHLKLIKGLLEALEGNIDYIDAIPDEAASRFPAMPAFCRDDSEEVITAAKKLLAAQQASPLFYPEESLQLAIRQTARSVTKETFADWVAGQKVIANSTGLLFCTFTESEGAVAYYRSNAAPNEVLPTLTKGQRYVWFSAV